jgi:perosamine synthetase
VRLTIPLTGDEELEEIRGVLESGYLTPGPKVIEFEKMVADMIGSKYTFATSSATTALHLSLVALEIKAGDEVLVPDFTFPATANVVVQQGAKPVLVDIELGSFAISIDDLKNKITPQTKAIMPVHPFGCSADMDAIMEISKDANLAVIEDAATAIGTQYYDRFVGSIGTTGCFSFHPRKVITTGEGGMIATDDDQLAERISILRSHGGVRSGFWYRYEEAGFNYRLSDVLGAIGVAQMRKLDWLIERKRLLAAHLRDLLADVEGITCPSDPPWGGHIYQSFVILVNSEINRDKVIADLRECDIETTLGTYALHDQPFFQRRYGYKSNDLPNSHFAFTQSITLPLYPQMNNNDIQTVAENLIDVIGQN